MKLQPPFREPVRVLRHGDGGVIYVCLTRLDGQGLADGGTWDIPTESIPFHLRRIGAEFLVIRPRFTPEDHDTPEEIRHMCNAVEIRELQADNHSA